MPQAVNTITTILTFLILISNFILMLNMWFTKLKSPEDEQNERIAKLETKYNSLEDALKEKDSRVRLLEEGNVVIQRALLALMSHAINGNDVDRLSTAKEDMERYLTSIKK